MESPESLPFWREVWYVEAGESADHFASRKEGAAVAVQVRDSAGNLVKLLLTAQHVLRRGKYPNLGEYYPEFWAWPPDVGLNESMAVRVTRNVTLSPNLSTPLNGSEDFSFLDIPGTHHAAEMAEILEEGSLQPGLVIAGFPLGAESVITFHKAIVYATSYPGWNCVNLGGATAEAVLGGGSGTPIEGVSGGGVFYSGKLAGLYRGKFTKFDQHFFIPVTRLRQWLAEKSHRFENPTPRERHAIYTGIASGTVAALAHLLSPFNLLKRVCRPLFAAVLVPKTSGFSSLDSDEPSGVADSAWLQQRLEELAQYRVVDGKCFLLWVLELLRPSLQQQPPLAAKLAEIEILEKQMAATLGLDLSRVQAEARKLAVSQAAGEAPVVQIRIHQSRSNELSIESVWRKGEKTPEVLLNTSISAEDTEAEKRAQVLEQLMAQMLGKIVDYAAEKSGDDMPRYELFLPAARIFDNPITWRALPASGKGLVIPHFFSTVLRSVERTTFGYARGLWCQKWEIASRPIAQKKWLEIHDPKSFEGNLDAKAASVAGCFFTLQSGPSSCKVTDGKTLLFALLQQGVPCFAWHYGADSTFAKQTWWKMLTTARSLEWQEQVRKKRIKLQQTNEFSPERDIAILVDDPTFPYPSGRFLGANFRQS